MSTDPIDRSGDAAYVSREPNVIQKMDTCGCCPLDVFVALHADPPPPAPEPTPGYTRGSFPFPVAFPSVTYEAYVVEVGPDDHQEGASGGQG